MEWNVCVLCEICIDKQQENTSVEELSDEDAICNWRELLAPSILANPVHQCDDDRLEDQVDNNDDEGDAGSESLGPESIREVATADGYLLFGTVNFSSINFIF